jgi:hypothetical protein
VTGFLEVAPDAGDMGRGSSAIYRRRRQERERHPRESAAQADAKEVPAWRTRSAGGAASDEARRAAASSCAWCGGAILPRSRGPIPKWCSATCRHRAWEETRAAASGRAAVQVVERRVEVPTEISPSRQAWPRILRELTRQLNDGRVYDRDLSALSVELGSLLEAYRHRQRLRGAPDLR